MKLGQLLAISALVAAAATITPAPSAATGDPEAGQKVFRKCATCHEVKAPKNKVGPHLVGIFGRPAGTVEGFKYSDAMKNSNVVWNEETISAYVKEPKAVPGIGKGRGRGEPHCLSQGGDGAIAQTARHSESATGDGNQNSRPRGIWIERAETALPS